MLRRSWRLGLGAVLLLGLGQSASFASVVLVRQERGIGARADTGFDGSPGYDKTFTGLGLFNEETTASIATPQDGDTASSRVTQLSTIADSHITASGAYQYENRGEFADGVSTVRVVFDVIGSQRYALSYDLEGVLTPNSRPARAPAARVELLRLDPSGDAVHRAFLRIHPEDEEFDDDVEFGGEGVLEPGRYEFVFEAGGLDFTAFPVDDTSNAAVSYNVALAFATDGGGGANPIPLPPGAWAGGAVLGAMMFGRLRKMLRPA
jgi:hypothetical protein